MSGHGDSSERLSVGVIGAGYIGQTVGGEFHRHAGATVAAVADPSRSAREEAANLFGLSPEAQYADHETMLEETPLDAVLIGTPHTLHYEQIVAALDRGMHVLCDKPITTDLDEARDIEDRVANTDQVVMIGYQRHINPAFIAARERWRGDLTPTWITAEICEGWIGTREGTWRLDPDLSGGGFLYDTGSHVLDAVLWTTGLTPKRVSARMTYADDERRIDDWAALTIEFEEGARATMTTYARAPAVREHIHVWDEEGAIYLDGQEWDPRELTEIDDESGERRPYFNLGSKESKAGAFIQSIRTGTEPPATLRDGVRVTAVTEAAYESARRGEPVELDPRHVRLE
ncbi:Gfo/Idh/MocA family protein [Halomarina halobia]|uniref:Gfo/Idh/MocA family protein n=1 Tax=Halomarina halobia TaxID=3033386 RepID=A0ABD6AD95_9EURY|nr:Gfo/Idh/MocA family oxidoreductase [Halomarina sp. PSR21]